MCSHVYCDDRTPELPCLFLFLFYIYWNYWKNFWHEQPSTLQFSDCAFSTILVSFADSTLCSAEFLLETISSLLENYCDQLELNCSLLEQISNSARNFMGRRQISQFVIVTIFYLAPTIIHLQLQTLTLRPKSPFFKLRFYSSDSRPIQASHNKGPCLYTLQLFKVSSKAVSRP